MQFLISFLLGILPVILFGQTATINYNPSTEDMPNPERGFYLPSVTFASNYAPLDANFIASKRNLFTPFAANYQVHTTLVFRYFVLDDFITADISQDFLNKMQLDFDAARIAGVKLIIRFSYTNTPPTGDCGNWICPPYGDATKVRILQHISQLQPLLESNKDILATVQMGFIGVWGEQYYTDHFGDASLPPYIYTTSNWNDRNEVLGGLLDAVPIERTVQVRYPQLKQRYVYGIAAPTNSAALSVSEAFNQTDKSRIGFHNDCFLASDTDFGTFSDYGPPVSVSDTLNLKPYKQNDSQFVPVGGETCFMNNPDDNCASANGRADTELDRFNYSFLNSEYNNDVNNDWTGVCLDDIKKKLGYRFAMITGTFPTSAESGEDINIEFTIENQGFTSPYNPRGLELVIRHIGTGDTYFAPLISDPRMWSPGSHLISETLCLPPNLPLGSYELLLNLPDPEPTLFDNPDFSIQLANQNIWESTTGYNNLNHTLQINSVSQSMACLGGQLFTSVSVYDEDFCPNLLALTNTIFTDMYQAKEEIISDAQIPQTEYPIYQAGNQITLDDGFEVEIGAVFWAVIQGCFE